MGTHEQRKVGSLRELPTSIEPPRDLWPQIQARLAAEEAGAPELEPVARPRRVPLRYMALAAMVACLTVGVWIGRDLVPLRGGTSVPLSAANPHPSVPGEAGSAVDAAYVSDPRYQRQRAQLVANLQARLDAMPPAARDKVAASLATIEKAKQDLERALGKDPSNALLQELLINTYQDEMRALADVHEASDPGRGI
ncbi:MAG: hypothetical protein JSR36_12755 [Proteobacteria bacterium]|nr:hypothetical protein [Pseudomonadota bacterium]